MIQLDILRGIAILLVLGRHPVVAPREAGFLTPFAGAWMRFGWTGVDLFFVLSGFLVGGLLLNELRSRSNLDVKRFLLRRAFKILPSYFVYLAYLVFILALGTGDPKVVLLTVAPSWVQLQNYLGQPPNRTHLWSLAVEEHFYLVLPFLFLLLFWRRPTTARFSSFVPLALIGAILGLTVARCIVNFGRPFSFESHFYPTHLRIDALLFGVLLAYLYPSIAARLEGDRRAVAILITVGMALVCPMIFLKLESSRFVPTIGYTLLYLGYGCILLATVAGLRDEGRWNRSREGRIPRLLALVGVFSYPIYLWHLDFARFPLASLLASTPAGIPSGAGRWLLATAAYLALALAAGVAMSMLVERPALALRDRLFPSLAPAVATQATTIDGKESGTQFAVDLATAPASNRQELRL